MSKSLRCGRIFRALNLALVLVVLGWICTAAPAHAKNYNVADFGIFPDGNDYTYVLQGVLAIIPAGSTLTFPAGTYTVSGLLEANSVKLVGQNATLNMVSGYQGGAVVLAGTKPGIQNFTVNNDGSNFSIQFPGTYFSAQPGLYVIGGTASITGCTFNGWQMDAVFFESAGNSSVTGNTFNVTDQGIGLFLLNPGDAIQTVTVTGNTFTDPNGPSQLNNGIYSSGPNALTVTKNSFTNFWTGINAGDISYAATTSVTYNTFSYCNWAMYEEYGDSVTFSNNDVQYGYVGIYEYGNGDVVINGNSFNFMITGAGIASYNDVGGLTAKGNTVIDGDNGIFISDDYSVVASTNNINSTNTAIQMSGVVSTAKLTNNFINTCGFGISDQGSQSVTVQSNSISNATGCAIYLFSNPGADAVSSNTLNNIGTGGIVSAAIDIEGPGGAVSVIGNTYNQGSPYNTPETEPTFYINVSQGNPTVKNNKTNTMLANFP